MFTRSPLSFECGGVCTWSQSSPPFFSSFFLSPFPPFYFFYLFFPPMRMVFIMSSYVRLTVTTELFKVFLSLSPIFDSFVLYSRSPLFSLLLFSPSLCRSRSLSLSLSLSHFPFSAFYYSRSPRALSRSGGKSARAQCRN